MRTLKTSTIFILMCYIFISFSQCSSTKQNSKIVKHDLEKKLPFTLGETSYKHWVAGVKGGGSGITLLIPITNNKNNIVVDSVYFRRMQSKVEVIKSGYVANFKTEANKRDPIIKNGSKSEESDNKKTNMSDLFPQLKDNECIISYKEKNKIKYFKIKNLVEKPRDLYPSAPPRG